MYSHIHNMKRGKNKTEECMKSHIRYGFTSPSLKGESSCTANV